VNALPLLSLEVMSQNEELVDYLLEQGATMEGLEQAEFYSLCEKITQKNPLVSPLSRSASDPESISSNISPSNSLNSISRLSTEEDDPVPDLPRKKRSSSESYPSVPFFLSALGPSSSRLLLPFPFLFFFFFFFVLVLIYLYGSLIRWVVEI